MDWKWNNVQYIEGRPVTAPLKKNKKKPNTVPKHCSKMSFLQQFALPAAENLLSINPRL